MQTLIDRAIHDITASTYAIALTGAGISTESGIPDFRGPQGVWTRNPEAERRAYRSYERFLADPKEWWRERLDSPGIFRDLDRVLPNKGHFALADLEKLGFLKCVITQNVDGLHAMAGTTHLLEYHGSVRKLRCVSCLARFPGDAFDLDALVAKDELPPRCPSCGGIIKSDGVAFGEPIPQDVAQKSVEEAHRCDLMLICGTSAVVYPFADLPRIARSRDVPHVWGGGNRRDVSYRPKRATIIEVNADPTPLTAAGISDYIIQGQTGVILPKIVEGVKAAGPVQDISAR